MASIDFAPSLSMLSVAVAATVLGLAYMGRERGDDKAAAKAIEDEVADAVGADMSEEPEGPGLFAKAKDLFTRSKPAPDQRVPTAYDEANVPLEIAPGYPEDQEKSPNAASKSDKGFFENLRDKFDTYEPTRDKLAASKGEGYLATRVTPPAEGPKETPPAGTTTLDEKPTFLGRLFKKSAAPDPAPGAPPPAADPVVPPLPHVGGGHQHQRPVPDLMRALKRRYKQTHKTQTQQQQQKQQRRKTEPNKAREPL